MIAALTRMTGWTSRAPSDRARRRAMIRIFHRADLALFQMPPAQLVRLVRHMVSRDVDLVVSPHDIATALGLHIRDIWRMDSRLCRKLDDRLHRKYVAPWPPVFSEAPAPSWKNSMSEIHACVYGAVSEFGVRVDDLMASGQLTATLAEMAETMPDILAPERWRALAAVLPTRLRDLADVRARAMGAANAAGAPLAMVEVLENSPLEEILKC